MKTTNLILLGIIVLALTGCADASHINECLLEVEHTYGFWGGLWHGMIFVFSLIGSLFSDDIAVYAVNNNGGFYDFGFWLGIGSGFVGINKVNK
jgi:hypothetical protein